VLQGRPVIVTRTFSKIAALAGMRLGYGVAPAGLIRQMSVYTTEGINAVVKWGGLAALKDTESQARVKQLTLALRRSTTDELTKLGFSVIPSEANFFMVDVRRPIPAVIAAFRARGVLVGRPFPPMMQHLRVSIGTADEMQRFMAAFRELVA
jgi:histidinol-phosphate aminotransferase